jgi:AraC-like DNA-binding protein
MLRHASAHSHEVWEIVLNLKGHGMMTMGETRFPFRPGTLVCQPPRVSHTKSTDGAFQDIYIQVSRFALAGAERADGFILLEDDAEKSFESLMTMIHRIYHKRENNYRGIIEELYAALEQLLIGRYAYTPGDPRIERLKDAMVGSFADPSFSLAKLLGDSAYCGDHLRRLFKQATGFTPLGYLTELRLNHAKKLMRENASLHYSVAEIGTMAGFDDISYFSRVFKKKTGVAPSVYQARGEGN